jgi:alpha-1,2-mannosyltransferase
LGATFSTGLIDTLRSGAWLTRARMRLWSLAVLIAAAGGLAFLLATAHGLVDFQNRPLGTDFSNIYAAGTYVLEGNAEAAFDPPLQYAREQAIFGEKTPFYGWHYPPFFLLLAAPLALLPYLPALALWQGATLLLYLLAIRAVLRAAPSAAPGARPADDRLWVLLAVAFPAVFVNLGHGHNGFLTATLLAGALVMLDRRPVTAGVLLGLMAYKPQFGLMIPLALAPSGRWRTMAAAAVTVILLALVATLAFGPNIWSAFLASTHFSRVVVLEAGDTGWHKMQSVFAWVRMWGGPVPLAYAVQAVVAIAVAAALAWLWRGGAPFALKAAALALGTILATPYSLDYDMMVLAPAIAFLAMHGLANGFGPFAKSALAGLWMVPLLARPVAGAAFVPLGAPMMLAAFALVLRESCAVAPARDTVGPPAFTPADAPNSS